MREEIEINCDLGEGMPSDAAMMPYLGSCNIACGEHAGDDETIAATVKLAVKHGVKVGAHPSYPDRKNFGRLPLDIPFEELQSSLRNQIHRVKAIATTQKASLHHIKLHGALYLESLSNSFLAENLIDFLQREFPEQQIYAPFGSAIERAASARSVRIVHEVFADRRYLSASRLLERIHPEAVLTNLAEIGEQVALFINKKQVKTVNGRFHPINAETICIHGDHPQAVAIAKLVAGITKPMQRP